MTKKQIAYKKSLLKLVHLSHTYKVFFSKDDTLWRDFLKREYGVSSSKELSIDELKSLVDYLNNKTNTLEKKSATSNQLSWILHSWELKSYKKDLNSLLQFIERVAKRKVKSVDELSVRDAKKVIAALNKMKNITTTNSKDS